MYHCIGSKPALPQREPYLTVIRDGFAPILCQNISKLTSNLAELLSCVCELSIHRIFHFQKLCSECCRLEPQSFVKISFKADFKPGREGTVLKMNHHPLNVEEPCLIRVSFPSYQAGSIKQSTSIFHFQKTTLLMLRSHV